MAKKDLVKRCYEKVYETQKYKESSLFHTYKRVTDLILAELEEERKTLTEKVREIPCEYVNCEENEPCDHVILQSEVLKLLEEREK